MMKYNGRSQRLISYGALKSWPETMGSLKQASGNVSVIQPALIHTIAVSLVGTYEAQCDDINIMS